MSTSVRIIPRSDKVYQLLVFFSNRAVYAHILRKTDNHIVAAASTAEKVLRVNLTNHRNKDAAASVGRAVAERSVAAGISAVHFNRPKGKMFHGKLRMLIDNIRDAGLPLH
mmetsp:Transcript_9288/g.42120  ORF Transcript_9288/g.42120 Transcript_9288/m.42120 type:complete len:111 (-) Transcript_9288:913-1245(-)